MGLREEIQHDGITVLGRPLYHQEVAHWNELLDPIFAKVAPVSSSVNGNNRESIGIETLARLGILDQVFTSPMRALLRDVMPDAILEHCYAYESEPLQDKSHVSSEQHNGWHRDFGTHLGIDDRQINFLYYFIYLTDVGKGNGAFEFRASHPDEPFAHGQQSVEIWGPSGTAFLWRADYWHRASPNFSGTRRRVIKMTFLHNFFSIPVEKRPDLLAAREHFRAEGNEFLSYLTGDSQLHWNKGKGKMLPETPGEPKNVAAYWQTESTKDGAARIKLPAGDRFPVLTLPGRARRKIKRMFK